MDQTIEPSKDQSNIDSRDCSVVIRHGQSIQNFKVRKGLGLQALSARNQTAIEYDCRKADCGICIVNIVSGPENLNPATKAEAEFLRAMHAIPTERLACQCRILGNVELEVDEY